METPGYTAWRILGTVHILMGLLLLPICMVLGLLLTPVLALGALWIVVLGVRLWRPSVRVGVLVWRTYRVALVLAALLCVYGIYALRAAEQSAAAGGGLLGAFGLLPLATGVLLAGTAVVSLWLTRTLKSGNKDADEPQLASDAQ